MVCASQCVLKVSTFVLCMYMYIPQLAESYRSSCFSVSGWLIGVLVHSCFCHVSSHLSPHSSVCSAFCVLLLLLAAAAGCCCFVSLLLCPLSACFSAFCVPLLRCLPTGLLTCCLNLLLERRRDGNIDLVPGRSGKQIAQPITIWCRCPLRGPGGFNQKHVQDRKRITWLVGCLQPLCTLDLYAPRPL